MRYLNRIIFLQSANIPYAEVHLDGNVHFIGTQGVGKSTVLRAILFFYNANTLKLGIPREKKPFVSFYLPKDNSYIVYEVMRENGPYCVVALKAQGRVAFRFIDAPYDRRWFVDERHCVRPTWTDIRTQLGKHIAPSAQVTSYEQFRDIIFGNNRRQELIPFRKYAIVESSKYQNIPLTIQNVFLNTKLDADFIKHTIINSMGDEEARIDLDFYRDQIKNFEQEYHDVCLWTDTNRAGENAIRNLAGKIIDTYRNLLYTRKLIEEMRRQLQYAARMAREQLPQYGNDIRESERELARMERLAGEEADKYDKERLQLNKKIGIIDDRLRRATKQRKHYADLGIDAIVQRVAQEEHVMQEKRRQEALLTELEKSGRDVAAKYRLLLEQVEMNLQAVLTAQQQLLNEAAQQAMEAKAKLMDELRHDEEVARQRADDHRKNHEARLHQLAAELQEVQFSRAKVMAENPFADEIEAAQQAVRTLKARQLLLDEKAKGVRQQTEALEREAQMALDRLADQQQGETGEVLKRKETLAQEKQQLLQLVERSKGSLAEWLDEHVRGWQNTIGRIADEETVLYNSGLQPALVAGDAADTMYGVRLHLDGVARKYRTPDELKACITQLDKEHEGLKAQQQQLEKTHETALRTLRKRYADQLRPLRDALRDTEAERQQLPLQLKQAEVDCNEAVQKLTDWRQKQMAELDAQLQQLTEKRVQQEELLRQTEQQLERQLKALQTQYRANARRVEAEEQTKRDEMARQTEEKRQLTAQERHRLEAAREEELRGKGVDTAALRACQQRIDGLESELKYIREHRETVFAYRRDKAELFDTEPQTRQERKQLQDDLNQLEEKYRLRRERIEAKRSTMADQLAQQRRVLAALEEGLKEVEAFRSDTTLCPIGAEMVGEQPTSKSCHDLVEMLKRHIYADISALNEFKKLAQQFLGRFSPSNVFSFNTQPVTDEEFFDFAANLCEFVDNDKIEEYKKGISDRYTHIINQISKEVGDITQREGAIRKTIEDINRDFQERNFVGVIREIALRQQPSADQLMQLLLRIKCFNDEHQFDMGAMDLFSSANHEAVNAHAVRYLLAFMKGLGDEPSRKTLQIADTFRLEFRIKENDNDTGWVEKIANVGSDGTDILVKAMVNIMLINVFKEKASKKFGQFKIHCMMDEIGKLHPNNVKGILDFANRRNILLVNSSPTTYNVEDYRYTYLLNKDGRAHTQIVQLVRKM